MLETYFTDADTVVRLRAGAAGRHMDAFARTLTDAGYAKLTVVDYLRTVGHLSEWMTRGQLAVEKLDDSVLPTFTAHGRGRRCSCSRPARVTFRQLSAVRRFLVYLRDHAVIAEGLEIAPVSEHIRRFETWMLHHRGVTSSTLEVYRPILLEFVRELGPPMEYTATDLRRFLSQRAARHGRSRAKTVVTALRMFLRFHVTDGCCSASLIDAVPTIPEWSLSALPQSLATDDVERLVAATSPGTPVGKRDRAIILLLARLGLRAGDVQALRFRDIAWDTGTLLVAGKGRRHTRLPLPQDVGDAILAYVADGRPGKRTDFVFVGACAPHRPFRRSSVVSKIVDRAVTRAGVPSPQGGAHVLRHSAATTLLRAGVPLAGIGALLRHRRVETTAQYAKVDVTSLKTIAQPWPLEASSC